MDECEISFMGLLLYYMLRWYETVYPRAVRMALHLYDARLMRLEQRIDVLPPHSLVVSTVLPTKSHQSGLHSLKCSLLISSHDGYKQVLSPSA